MSLQMSAVLRVRLSLQAQGATRPDGRRRSPHPPMSATPHPTRVLGCIRRPSRTPPHRPQSRPSLMATRYPERLQHDDPKADPMGHPRVVSSRAATITTNWSTAACERLNDLDRRDWSKLLVQRPERLQIAKQDDRRCVEVKCRADDVREFAVGIAAKQDGQRRLVSSKTRTIGFSRRVP